ncbi:MAG: DUF1569 domain-containing protein [Flavobacteriaceae bacterium]|nr:DUF1569 domain-containing protein [Flavobacteriaceae bacterium]
MKNLFQETDYFAIRTRIEQLQAGNPRHWGKMNVAQMLAHVNEALETAMGKNHPKRMFMGRIFGSIFKKKFLSRDKMPKNLSTDASYVFPDTVDFESQKEIVLKNLDEFYQNGPKLCTNHPHIFFGKLTPMEWGKLHYIHFNHHLSQFGA